MKMKIGIIHLSDIHLKTTDNLLHIFRCNIGEYTLIFNLYNTAWFLRIHVNRPFYDDVKKGDTFKVIQYKGRICIYIKYHIGEQE